MSVQTLAQAFANVRDFGAVGDGVQDDSLAIQGAIDDYRGRHLLFPEGVYKVGSEARTAGRTSGGAIVEFGNDGQRARFESGARIQLASTDDFVRVSGSDQAFDGIRIHAGDHDSDDDAFTLGAIGPMLDVVGAERLTFRDLRVTAQVAVTPLVRVRSVTNCRFTGGRLLGNSDTAVGLLLGKESDSAPTAVSVVSALGLSIDEVGIGVAVVGTAEAVRFTGCRFGETPLAGVVIGGEQATTVRGFNLLGCRFSEGLPDRWIQLRETASVSGMTVSGTRFGALAAKDAGRVLLVEGALSGAVVSGCAHDGSADAPGSVVWELGSAAVLGGVADIANARRDIDVLGGTRTGRVTVITSDTAGTLSLTATAVRVESTLESASAGLGFFGVPPVAGNGPFTGAARSSHVLTDGASAGDVREVLRTLVWDLQRRGILRPS